MQHLKSLGSAKRVKRSDQIAEEIKKWIAIERKQPGDRLPLEKDLIEAFGASKGTVREALKSLEVQGLISLKTGPKGGATLVPVTYDRATQLLRNYLHFQDLTGSQLYSLRKILEPELAERVVGRLSEDDFAALEEKIAICDHPPRDWEERRAQRMAELDFHTILAERCEDPLLALICRFLNDLLRDLVVYKKLRLPEQVEFSRSNLRYHKALIEAYRREDKETVLRLMREHMEEAEAFNREMDGQLEQCLLTA